MDKLYVEITCIDASPSDLLPAQKDADDSRFGGTVAMGVVSNVLGRFRKRG